jgi:hypothetical protein
MNVAPLLEVAYIVCALPYSNCVKRKTSSCGAATTLPYSECAKSKTSKCGAAKLNIRAAANHYWGGWFVFAYDVRASLRPIPCVVP